MQVAYINHILALLFSNPSNKESEVRAMPFKLLGNGPRLAEPLERDNLSKVVLSNGLAMVVATATIPGRTPGEKMLFHYIDPEFIDMTSVFNIGELSEIRGMMFESILVDASGKTQPGWDAAFINEAMQYLVLSIVNLKVGRQILSRWHSLLHPVEGFGGIQMPYDRVQIRSIESISLEKAHFLMEEEVEI